MITPDIVADFVPETIVGTTEYLPKYEDIPSEFHSNHNPYNDFISHWFFSGLDPNSDKMNLFVLKPEYIEHKARHYIFAFLRSHMICRNFPNGESLDHNHKIAGVGFLMSQIFDYAG